MTYGAVRNIVVHYVIATSIRAEMLGKSTVCVCYGYFIESGITGQFGCFEQKFQELQGDEYADPEDKDEYTAENIFFVPAEPDGARLVLLPTHRK